MNVVIDMMETQKQRRARFTYAISRPDLQLLNKPSEQEVIGVAFENNRPMSAYEIYTYIIPVYVNRVKDKDAPRGEYNIHVMRGESQKYGSLEGLAKYYRDVLKKEKIGIIPSFPRLARLLDDFAESGWFERTGGEKREQDKKKKGRPPVPVQYNLPDNVKDKVRRIKDFSQTYRESR